MKTEMPFEALNLMNLKQVAKITSNFEKLKGKGKERHTLLLPFDSNMNIIWKRQVYKQITGKSKLCSGNLSEIISTYQKDLKEVIEIVIN